MLLKRDDFQLFFGKIQKIQFLYLSRNKSESADTLARLANLSEVRGRRTIIQQTIDKTNLVLAINTKQIWIKPNKTNKIKLI